MFDVLTYLKGGSVVRMLERWLGASAFRDGVRYYLDRYQLANTETTDLWDALEHATGRPARRIMDSWIFQPGCPEISVEPVEGALRVSQRRFRYDGAAAGERWSIPMLVREVSRGEAESKPVLLDEESILIPDGDGAPMVLNAGGEGFYRIAYPPSWPARLVATGALSPRERFVLVDDAWAGVVTGSMRAAEFLEFAMGFHDESDVTVWRALIGRLRGLARIVDGEALAALRARVGALISPHFARLGWDPSADEGPRDRQLRGLLLEALGTLADDSEAIAGAREHRDRPSTDADVVAACIAITARHGDAALFDEYATRFRQAESPQGQLRYLYALTMFADGDLVVRATAMALTDDVRTQNAPFMLQRALAHPEHGPRVWPIVRDRWDVVEGRVPRMLIARMFEGVTWLIDDASVRSVAEFVADHPVPEGAQIIAQHVERQRTNQALFAREAADLAAHLTTA
jgi:puromycin-sensitive aminopeptidase